MALPAIVAPVTIHGQWFKPDGTYATGEVRFTGGVAVVRAPGADAFIATDTRTTATLNATGEITVALPATDDPALTPVGWVYQVTVALAGVSRQVFNITVPLATVGVLELSDLVTSAEVPLLPALGAYVSRINGASGDVTLTKSSVGLGNVDNTTDLAKPVSTAALALLETQTHASGTYAPLVFARPLPRVVVIGDSIENLYSFRSVGATSSSEQYGKDWPTYAMLLSNGRFQLVRNMGNGGENTAQYLARYDADVTPSAPSMVVIGGAENDIQQSVPIATTRANIVALVAKTRATGAVPVLRTTMPHFASAAVRKSIGAVNHWARGYCAVNGIICLDFWRQLVDTANGQYLAAYSADGVHPNEAGGKILGQYVVDTLCATIPATPLSLAADPTDTGQLLATPLFTTNTAGTPTGWNAIGGSPAGVTRSMVVDPLVPGQMARLALVAGSAVSLNNTSIGTAQAAAGDVLEVSGVLTSDGGVAVSVNVAINYNDGVAKNIGRLPASIITAAFTRGTYYQRLPAIPAGFTGVVVTLQAAAGTGVVDFGYPTVRNLTREGIA